ncbi:MAG: hypothetical protein IJU41_07020 [Clostridia bacterium]|nr:hypothetical protein [Clostridia bacterium]
MKTRFYAILRGLTQKTHLGRRIALAAGGVLLMGLGMAVLEVLNFGTDPYTCLNNGLSMRTSLSLGTCGVLVSLLMFGFVFAFDASKIGIGTLCNMVGFGYAIELFRFILRQTPLADAVKIPFVRIALLVLMLAEFIFAVSLYLAADLGSAPYDAVPEILTKRLRKPFVLVRMIWDAAAVCIGFLLGSTVGVTTVVCALGVGPMAALVKRLFEDKL